MQDTIVGTTQEIVIPQVEHVNEHPVTSVPAEPLSPKFFRPYAQLTNQVASSIAKTDSIAKAKEDSIVRAKNDSLARIRSGYGIVLEDPYYVKEVKGSTTSSLQKFGADGLSWVYVVLSLMFCLICFKSRGNKGYIQYLFTNLNTVKLRHNMFDATVKESSFTFILNANWVLCSGILLWIGMKYWLASEKIVTGVGVLEGIGLCIGVMLAYKLIMLLGYIVAGNVFSDYRTTKEWVGGANSENSLESLLLFPLALLGLCYPAAIEGVIWGGISVIGVGKILFIFKGFRIFVKQFSSFLLFLYYLCTMEVIPIILVLICARALLENW